MMKVLLTRPLLRSSDNDELHRILNGAGIIIEEIPMISFSLPPNLTELDSAIQRSAHSEFDYIILSSPTATHFFEERVHELALLNEIRQNARFGAVGETTARSLINTGFEIHFPIPSEGGNNELITLLSESNLAGKHILLLQSQIGLNTLENALREIGALPERVTLYHTNDLTPADAARLIKLLQSTDRPNVIAFFSPSAVTNFAETLAGTGLLDNLPTLAAIGKTTANAIEETLHRTPEIIAPKADMTSMANEIIRLPEP
jgi:uroporphyrinogen III methyltransferase/synthase